MAWRTLVIELLVGEHFLGLGPMLIPMARSCPGWFGEVA